MGHTGVFALLWFALVLLGHTVVNGSLVVAGLDLADTQMCMWYTCAV